MAELPSKAHLNLHPVCLWRGHAVYEDKNQRTWLTLLLDIDGVLIARLHQKDLPRGHYLLTTSPLTSSTLAWMWTLHPGGQYVDPMFRYWRIVHHLKENCGEEMTLELVKDM